MPVIPTDHWSDQGDGTVWTLLADLAGYCKAGEFPELLNRLCDTCGGFRSVNRDVEGVSMGLRCPDCDGVGRHTFDVEVAAANALSDDCSSPLLRRRVSVAAGMVLPVFGGCPDYDPADHICQCYADQWTHHSSGGPYDHTEERANIPTAAEPGMWAVKLVVHDDR